MPTTIKTDRPDVGRRRQPWRRLILGISALCLCNLSWAGEPAPADVVDALKQLAPTTVTVDRVEFLNGSDKRFQISGRADRNATVSNYLRALDTSEGFHKTELLQIMLDANGRPSFEIMLDILLIVVIGGMGTMYGAVVGALLFVLAQNYLQDLLKLAYGALEGMPLLAPWFSPDRWLLWLGVLFVLSVYHFPSGVVGRLRALAVGLSPQRPRPPQPHP